MASTESTRDRLFVEWEKLNDVLFAYRSRFDELRKKFRKCVNRAAAKKALSEEGFDGCYPRLPEWLK